MSFGLSRYFCHLLVSASGVISRALSEKTSPEKLFGCSVSIFGEWLSGLLSLDPEQERKSTGKISLIQHQDLLIVQYFIFVSNKQLISSRRKGSSIKAKPVRTLLRDIAI